MLSIILNVLWFLLPAGIANMVPPLVMKVFPSLDYPMDFGIMLFGKRLFGDHKTWRGFVFGILIAEIVFILQQQTLLEPSAFNNLITIDYVNLPWFIGLLLGMGALLGDAFKSLFKRQANIKSGESWFPWDQIDWVIGSVILTAPFVYFGYLEIIVMIIVGLGLHLLFKVLGYWLGLNKDLI